MVAMVMVIAPTFMLVATLELMVLVVVLLVLGVFVIDCW